MLMVVVRCIAVARVSAVACRHAIGALTVPGADCCCAQAAQPNEPVEKAVPVPILFLIPSLALLPHVPLSVFPRPDQGVRGRCWFQGERAVGAHDSLPALFVQPAKVVAGRWYRGMRKRGCLSCCWVGEWGDAAGGWCAPEA